MKRILFILFLIPQLLGAQDLFDLNGCLHYAIENNRSLQKDRLSLRSAALSRREVVGAWLPQISASGNFTYNIQKTTVAMPNFMNSFLPEQYRTDEKYMKVEMGMDFAPNFGANVAQQVLNLSLLNAVKIAQSAEEMAKTGLMLSTVDVVLQTATLYYNIQVLDYAVDRFQDVIDLMDRTLSVMNANRDEGLMRDVDIKRITVNRTNLETQRQSLSVARQVQSRLLKLQMGFPMDGEIALQVMNEDEIVEMIYSKNHPAFDYSVLPAYRMLKSQQKMLGYQYKSAVSANLPTLVLIGNYSMNYMWDFGNADSHSHFPMSMVSLGMKLPIFTGGSGSAKVKRAKVDIMKSEQDEQALVQALSMSYLNSRTQLDRHLGIVEAQLSNKELARDVYEVTQTNFAEGISSLTDVLNASSSLVQAEMNFATSLSNCITAYFELRRAEGTILDIVK